MTSEENWRRKSEDEPLGCERDASAHADRAELASTLITNTDKQARSLLAFVFGEEPVAKLKAVEWTVVGESVFAPRWRNIAKSHSEWLSRFMADVIPIGQHQFIRLGSELVRGGEQNVNSRDRRSMPSSALRRQPAPRDCSRSDIISSTTATASSRRR
jgi:hypothetical protein